MSLAANIETHQVASLGKRVLVAEDSPVTQDLLELVLTQRGHHVDIAKDGEAAFAALSSQPYDIALLDYRLPKLSGLEVALKLRATKGIKNDLRIIAITADSDSLQSQEDALKAFERIIPKPFDINDVLSVVEGDPDEVYHDEAADDANRADHRVVSPDWRSAKSPVEQLDYTFLRWPQDFNASVIADRAKRAASGELIIDAVLIETHTKPENLASLWRHRGLHLLPVIDLTGSVTHRADLDVSKLKFGETAAVQQLIQSFHQRRDRVHRDMSFSTDMGEKLLGRMYVTEAGLQAFHDPTEKSLVSYNTLLANKTIAGEAGSLCDRGLLEQDIFDRVHVCGQCGSSRFNVREECSKCRSPALTEESYLHHFKCAYQGPESDFREGDDLICPKCRKELSHFSVDYDKPGTFMVCGKCSSATTDPAVGFVCLDCGAHSDGESISTSDVYSYYLTDQGRALVEVGRDLLGPAHQSIRFSELPLEFVVALNREAKRFNEHEIPFAVAEISYRNERDLVHEIGYRQFALARRLFLDNLRNQLGKDDVVKMGQAYDFALLTQTGQYEARTSLSELQASAADTLKYDLGISINVFGPRDFA